MANSSQTPNGLDDNGKNRVKFNGVSIPLVAVILTGVVIMGISLGGCGKQPNPAASATLQATASPAAMATASPAAATAAPTASPAATASAQPTAAPTATPSEFFTGGDVQLDKATMTYKSADLYVKVTNVKENGVNYYIADCRMQADKLFTAFAYDKYALHKEEKSSVMAKRKGAVIAVNGDYFGSADSGASDKLHRNGKGLVIRNGTLYPRKPWYDIAAIYGDGTMKTFDKADVTGDQLLADGAQQAFNFGPMLLDENGKALSEDALKKRPPLLTKLNPRTGIGYIEPDHFVLVVVDGRGKGGSKGMTTAQFAQLFESLGCKTAYNLDGGGSATMVFMGKVLNHPCDASGERSVSDIIYFGESAIDTANIGRMTK